MSNYQINQASRTTSTVMMAGLLASQLLAGHTVSTPTEGSQEALFAGPYRTTFALPSFDQIRNIFGSALDHRADQFVEGIANFYTRLVASQEPLGARFAHVLHENLWDLYER